MLLTAEAATEIFTLIMTIQTESAKSVEIDNTDCKQFTFFNTADAWFCSSLFTECHKSHFEIDQSVVLEFVSVMKQNKALDQQRSQFDHEIEFMNMRERRSFHYSHNVIQVEKTGCCGLDREWSDSLRNWSVNNRDCGHSSRVCEWDKNKIRDVLICNRLIRDWFSHADADLPVTGSTVKNHVFLFQRMKQMLILLLVKLIVEEKILTE